LPRSPPFPYTTLFRSRVDSGENLDSTHWPSSQRADYRRRPLVAEQLLHVVQVPQELLVPDGHGSLPCSPTRPPRRARLADSRPRSEEHTSELQSLRHL